MKVLLISAWGGGTALGWRFRKEGHQVKMWIKPHDGEQSDVGDGFIDKVKSWEENKGWADFIVMDDGEMGKISESLKKEGKIVWGGSEWSDQIELDRGLGQKTLKEVGMAIIPSQEFTKLEEAIAFVKSKPNRYVVKPSGPIQNEKALTYVGKQEDGSDLIATLEQYKLKWAGKIKKVEIQEVKEGVEVGISGFFNGKEFVDPIEISFEHKKLMNGNIGPSTGEMGCGDEQTEVLTKNGWKFFKAVTYEDEFATMNPETEILEYHRPSDIVYFDDHKELVQIKNRSLDLAITKNHNMFGQEANSYRKSRKWGFCRADELPSQFVSPRSCIWIGKEEKTFVLPAIQLKNEIAPAIHIDMDIWLQFFGFWLADGWTCEKNYSVGVCGKIPRKDQFLKRILPLLALKFKKINEGVWRLYSKQLWSYLHPIGQSLTKFVPCEYKELSPRQLGILFDSMCRGDGNQQPNGFRIYYTSSPRMADDVQEILLKIGRVGIVKKRERKHGSIFGRNFKTQAPCYEVTERIKKTVAWIDKRDTKIIPYHGRVYCVTVPYHTLYFRRNGKPVWCGNTSMVWMSRKKIYKESIGRMVQKLSEHGYRGYLDINCIAEGKTLWPLEFTTRFGYPTIQMKLETLSGNLCDTMYQVARGDKKNFKISNPYSICVVIATPPYPFESEEIFQKYGEDQMVIFNSKDRTGIWPAEVKRDKENNWYLAGGSGFSLICTGQGKSLQEAKKMAYRRVESVTIPNAFWRSDIGDKTEADLKKLHSDGWFS